MLEEKKYKQKLFACFKYTYTQHVEISKYSTFFLLTSILSFVFGALDSVGTIPNSFVKISCIPSARISTSRILIRCPMSIMSSLLRRLLGTTVLLTKLVL